MRENPERGQRRPIRRQELFDLIDELPARTLCRRNGPVTSADAAEEIVRTGERARHSEIVLRAVLAHPGLTSSELHEQVPSLDLYQLRRRLPDLKNAGLIRPGEVRQCRVTNRRQLTWYAT